MRWFPGRLRPLLWLGATLLLVGTLTRGLFLVMAAGEIRAGLAAVALALAAGTVRDLIVAAWLLLPWHLYLQLVPERWHATRLGRLLLRGGLGVAFGGIAFVTLSEILFFAEFRGRFNFVAVDYLIYPTEVIGNLRESFPLGWIVVGVVGFIFVVVRLLRSPVAHAVETGAAPAPRLVLAGGHLLLLLLGRVTGAGGEAWTVDDRTIREIGDNGYLAFGRALLGADAPYEGLYATRPAGEEVVRVRAGLAESALSPDGFRNDGDTWRELHPAGPPRRLNVVVVLEESLGSEFVGGLDSLGRGWTPALDSLMALGTMFTDMYSTGNRTIRALEATTASIPPLPGISIVRRTASEGLFTLPAFLRAEGYATTFIYGGRALFDGMGHYMAANGVDQVIDQGAFPDSAFRTAWGVADEYIFDRALAQADSVAGTGRSFYQLVLTVSNHRPYTYPPGRIAEDPGAKQRVHAVRYADWALGRFMARARGRAWYDQTIFVLMGDHGARVYGASEIPLASYQVPVLVIAPGVPAGSRIGTRGSSLDVPPTVLARLGHPYMSPFFGRDLFTMSPEEGRALMTHNTKLALMKGDGIAVLDLHARETEYRWDPGEQRFRAVVAPDSADRAQLSDAVAYYHLADRLYRSGRMKQ